jgi:hypothetical protein
MSTAPDEPSTRPIPHTNQILTALRRAAAAELERKRRLGHYAVSWENGEVVLRGDDAPTLEPRALQAAEPQGPVYAVSKHEDASN